MSLSIIPVETIAQDFYYGLTRIKHAVCKEQEDSADEMDLWRCHEFTMDKIDAAINAKLIWVDKGQQTEQLDWSVINELKDVFVWTEQITQKELIEELECLFEELEVTIRMFIDDVIPKRTWRIYTTRRLGHDLVIERGRDYRIEDWERRMKTGEWSDAND